MMLHNVFMEWDRMGVCRANDVHLLLITQHLLEFTLQSCHRQRGVLMWAIWVHRTRTGILGNLDKHLLGSVTNI